MSCLLSSDGKWEHSHISGNGNLWTFLEILEPLRISGSSRKSVEISILDFHTFSQISIDFHRFFKKFPKISGKFLKMVKCVKRFCVNSWFETKHLSNSSLIFNIKKCRSNFGHVLNTFRSPRYFEIFAAWKNSNFWATRVLKMTILSLFD